MAANLSPIGNGITFFNAQGVINSAGKIYTCVAGSVGITQLSATYTDSTQAVQNANPIIIGTNGMVPNEIWLSAGSRYKFVITDSNNNVLATLDNLIGINDTSLSSFEWIATGITPTFISGTSFSMSGDQTGTYTAGRRVRAFATAGTLYGTVVSSTFSSNITTVVITVDSAPLDNGLSAVNVSFLSSVNQSIPSNLQNVQSIDGNYIGEFRNPVTNGNFQIDQRNEGASQTFTASAALAYCVDAWYGACSGANITGQQVTVSGQKRYKFTGAASNTGVTFGHRMLSFDTFHYAGNTATLMVKAASSSITTLTWAAYYATSNNAFGTLGSPTRTQIATGTFTISSTEAQYAVQISVQSAATTGIEIVFTTGALLATQTLQFGDVAFLPSSVSETFFPRRPKNIELQLSQRFYWKTFPQGTAPAQNAGVSGALTIGSNAASTFSGSFQLPVVMWTASATTTTYNPSAANANFRDANNAADRTLNAANPSDAQINLSGLAGVANGINRIHVTLDSPIP